MSSLIKLNETIITSSTSSATITGISSDYDVHLLTVTNLKGTAHDQPIQARITQGGTAISTSNYDISHIRFIATGSPFTDRRYGGGSLWHFEFQDDTPAQSYGNWLMYLYNFNSTTNYASISYQAIQIGRTSAMNAPRGSATFRGTGTANDGISFFQAAGGNIEEAELRLYGLKK